MSNRDESAARIVRDLAAARARGERITDEAVLAAHPDLRDELVRELHKLNVVGETQRPQGESDPAFPTVPGYLVVEYIGGGGQASVYEGVMLSTSRRVAIKVLHGGQFSSEESKARFLREKETLARLSHRNIVSILDRIVTPQGHDCLIMDYVRGITLKEYLQQMTADVEAAVRSRGEMLGIFIKIARAVGAAHQSGVVHRDLKPSNIQLDMAGEPYVLDFGLARSTLENIVGEHASETEAEPVTITGQFVGSLPWASPEQAMGDPGRISARSDVYSLGVILYQIITAGAFPYQTTGSMVEALDRVLRQTPASPTLVLARRYRQGRGVGSAFLPSPSIEPAIESVVLRALSKRPEARYADANELADAIEMGLKAPPPALTEGSAERATSRKVTSMRFRVGVTALVTLMLTAVIMFLTSGTTPAPGSRASTDTPTQEQDPSAHQGLDVQDVLSKADPSTSPEPEPETPPAAPVVESETADPLIQSSEQQPRTTAVAESPAANRPPQSTLRVPADYSSIAEAIEKAAANAVVMVSPRAEGYRERLDITRNITIKGVGTPQVEIRSDHGIMITVRPGVSATIQNLSLTPHQENTATALTALVADRANVTIDRCRFSGFVQSAVVAEGGTIALTSCVLTSVGTGVESRGADITVDGGTFQQCRDKGVWVRERAKVEVRGCLFQDNQGIGLLVDCPKTSLLAIDDCRFTKNAGGGAEIRGDCSGAIQRGTFAANSGFGLKLQSVDPGSARFVVRSATVSGTTDGHGVLVSGSKGVTLEACRATDNNDGYGCWIRDGSTDIAITDGEYLRNKAGLWIVNGSSVSVRSSKDTPLSVSNNEDIGLTVNDSTVDIAGGVFEYNSVGMMIMGRKAKRDGETARISGQVFCKNNRSNGIWLQYVVATITDGVECVHNAHNGLLVDFGSQATVRECVFSSNTHQGIWVAKPESGIVATNNLCQHNIGSGIALASDVASCQLTKNSCIDNQECGIRVDTTLPVIAIEDNTCNDNKEGIFIAGKGKNTKAAGNTCTGNTQFGICVREGAVCTLSKNRCIKNKIGICSWSKDTLVKLMAGNVCEENSEYGLHVGNEGACSGSGILFAANGKCDIKVDAASIHKATKRQISPSSQRGDPNAPKWCED